MDELLADFKKKMGGGRMTTRAYDKLVAANSIVGSITTDQLENIEEAQACIEALKAIRKAIKIEQESKSGND